MGAYNISDSMIAGRIVGGNDKEIIMREKKGVDLELGNLLAIENEDKKYLLMVSALEYGSLIHESRLVTSAGSMLEGTNPNIVFPESDLTIYRSIKVKILLEMKPGLGKVVARTPRSIPKFMSQARDVISSDFSFLEEPKNKIYLGRIRSGTKVLDYKYSMDGGDMLSHHVLISAQTGRGKSNLVKVMLWETMKHDSFGMLIMDVHNEYYGHGQEKGLKDHPDARKALAYYSKSPPPGQKSLRINLKCIVPQDIVGILELSEAQKETLEYYHKKFKKDWISSLMAFDEEEKVNPGTLRALRRKFGNLFNLHEQADGAFVCSDDVFDMETMGEGIIDDMADAMETGKTVLVDGSSISDDTGLIIASAVLREVFYRYDVFKTQGMLKTKPQIGVVLEEAPRVLAGAYGQNVFSRIAREGRKFKIGLLAVTQLASMIPKDILANIGTKVIMGNEMALERRTLMESSAQDLTAYDQIIAGLDKGEAIVSSIFSKFPVPIQIPLFDDIARTEMQATNRKPVTLF
jgi:hypothetical protein